MTRETVAMDAAKDVQVNEDNFPPQTIKSVSENTLLAVLRIKFSIL